MHKDIQTHKDTCKYHIHQIHKLQTPLTYVHTHTDIPTYNTHRPPPIPTPYFPHTLPTSPCLLAALEWLCLTLAPFPQVDFTSCTGLFCVLGIVMMVTGIVTAIVLAFKYVSVPES